MKLKSFYLYFAVVLSTLPGELFSQGLHEPEDTSPCFPADIMIVADMSSSVNNVKSFIWDAVAVLPNKYKMHDSKVRMGLIRFNETPTLVTPLTGDRGLFLDNLEQTRTESATESTNILSALELADQQFSSKTRRDALKLVILVTDGLSQVNETAEVEFAETMKINKDITIIGVHTQLILPPQEENFFDPDEVRYKGKRAINYGYRNLFAPTREQAEASWKKGGNHLKNLTSEGFYFESEYQNLVELFEGFECG